MQLLQVKGAAIPVIGLGTWRLRGKEAFSITEQALNIGYRHIDTAQMYANEEEIGKAIKNAGVERDQLFLTTKVWWENLHPSKFTRSVEASLTKLRVDQVDLLLIHWPHPDLELAVYLDELMAVQKKGYTRFIGVSNFSPAQVEQALARGAELITNQVEYHPFLDQSEVLEVCRRHGLTLTAYAPIARGRVLEDATIREIAGRHGKTPVQVTLRWHLQQAGVIAIPKTSTPARLAENIDLFDFELSNEDMQQITALTQEEKRLINPDF